MPVIPKNPPAIATVNPSLTPVFPTTMRCPVPPTTFTPDSSLQFYRGGIVPQFRAFTPAPLSNNNNAGGGTTVENSESSSSTVINNLTLSIKSAALTTPVLNPGQSYQGQVTVSQAYILLSVAATAAARVRVYATAAAQTSDNPRPITTALNFQTTQNVIADINITSSPYLWNMSPIVCGQNADTPQSSIAYVTVTNDQATSTAITATLTYIGLV